MTIYFFQIDGDRFRGYDQRSDAEPIYSTDVRQTRESLPDEDVEPEGSGEFAYEADLRNYLAKNLSVIEPGLMLYEEEGIRGIEFPTGGRFIDILALDRNGDLVVAELKVSRGYDRVDGQLARYIAWIKRHQAEFSQQVRGIIVAREISKDLLLACSMLKDVELFEYKLSLTFKSVTSDSRPPL